MKKSKKIVFYKASDTIDNRGNLIAVTMNNGTVVKTVFRGYKGNKMMTDEGEIDLSDIKVTNLVRNTNE